MSVKTIPVDEYVSRILQGRDRITSKELQINGDFDYVMLMMVVMGYDNKVSPYSLDLLEGQAVSEGYSVPNLVISRRL